MLCNLVGDKNPMGDYLGKLLDSGKYSKLRMLVAFVKQSGVGRLLHNFMNFRNSGGEIEAVVGIDQHITSFQAIQQLSTLSNNNLYIHHDRGASCFHPKVFIFEKNNIPEAIFVGSSNLTTGGLFSNYEANVLLSPQGTEEDKLFLAEIGDFYSSILRDSNTQKAQSQLLSQLYSQGLVTDETRTREFDEIIKTTTNIPFKSKRRFQVPKLPSPIQKIPIVIPVSFAMVLSKFDVSLKSLDPVILVPLVALRQFPLFWQWPMSFTLSGGGYPQRYTTARVNIPEQPSQTSYIRLYYYNRKKEFRLQCEPVKRNGHEGDLVLIERPNNKHFEYEITLIPSNITRYNQLKRICTTKVSANKYFGYQ